MKNLIKKWDGVTIQDDGAYASQEWKSFSRAFKNAVRREGMKRGYEIVGRNSFGQSHYFTGGHVAKDGMAYYISFDYDRFRPLNLTEMRYAGPILWRRALDEKDYCGGTNRFTTADKLFDDIEVDYAMRLREEQNG